MHAVTMILVVACAPLPKNPTHPTIDLSPDSEGIAVFDTNLRIDFGRYPDGVIAALTREFGPPKEMDILSCPAGVVRQLDWQNLILSFGRERFLGWRKLEASAGQVCRS